MSTAVLNLNHWNLEYYQTMKTTERARLTVAGTQEHAVSRRVGFIAQAALWYPFYALTRDTNRLVSRLDKFEAFPASVLLEEDAEKMPQELQNLFKKMCNLIRQIENIGLSDGLVLRNNLVRLSELSQQIKGYADRFADAQNKLRSRVPEDQVQHYQEAFAAYGNCKPIPDEFTEDDAKSQLLRF
jgi:hypothetical protein